METEENSVGRYDKIVSDLTVRDVVIIGATLYVVKECADVVSYAAKSQAIRRIRSWTKTLQEKTDKMKEENKKTGFV